MEVGRTAGTVVVVGAGVSGCACAAALAEAGFQVTLVNSANDRVCLPAYGPNVVESSGDPRRLQAVFDRLARPVRAVWLDAALTPAHGDAIINVDRRRVSIEMKRVLEKLHGIRFRQGMVVDLRWIDAGESGGAPSRATGPGDETPREAARPTSVGVETTEGVEVETIFGEVLGADAVVVAVGLSLSARGRVGEEQILSGRYGEPASDGLYRALEALGAGFRDVSAAVGGSVSGEYGSQLAWEGRAPAETRASLAEEILVPASSEPPLAPWPEDYPPAPHWFAALGRTRMLVYGEERESAAAGLPRARVPALSPDGAAADEFYVTPRAAGHDWLTAASRDGVASFTRLPLVVTAAAVSSLSSGGRLILPAANPAVWVCGRAGGAPGYLESLESGVSVAHDVTEYLRGGGR